MAHRFKTVLPGLFGAALLLPGMASALPLLPPVSGTPGKVTPVAGFYCDLDGCRTFETRRRIYVEPPFYDGPGAYDDEPPVYRRPREGHRIWLEPPPPRRIYRDRILSRDHVRWCLDRYRSYNPATDLYLARKNVYRRCISPWS